MCTLGHQARHPTRRTFPGLNSPAFEVFLRELIEAHLSVVFAALAVGRLIEDRTGWTIKKFVRAARRYRTVHIGAGQQILTAADPFPPDLRDALTQIRRQDTAH
jgi:hypothetical protein